jgi:peptide/nickel transport system ATP-binding protein
MPRLHLDDIHVDYTVPGEDGPIRKTAVDGVSIVVEAGATLGIAGESGSGKSTLAMAVLRLLPANAAISGSIRFGDEDILSLSWGRLRAVRWTEAAIVFQGAMHSLNPVQRVRDQIAEALEIHRSKAYPNEEKRFARVAELLALVDLTAEKGMSYPHELSGGQKQRVMIAMALACDPELIIADEPTTALDVIVQAQVLDVLTDLVRERGLSLVMISHDLSVLAATCENICVMQNGRIVEEGPSVRVMTAPEHPHTRALAAAFPTIGEWSSRKRLPSFTAPDAPPLDGSKLTPHVPVVERESVLEVRDLSVRFAARGETVRAVDHVDLRCNAGEIVALVGQSGSGKTTLARTILGLQRPTSGEVLFRGSPLGRGRRALKEYRRQVQFVLQDPTASLNPKHSVYDAVAEGPRLHRLPGDERERVSRALREAELSPPESFFSAIPQELSGGQRQRVVIAGALALDPSFLVADEPVASLDASARGEILALFMRLKYELGLGALIITHDLGLAWNIADRVVVMRQGVIVEEGPVEEVLLAPKHEYTQQLLSVVPSALVAGNAEDDVVADLMIDVVGESV